MKKRIPRIALAACLAAAALAGAAVLRGAQTDPAVLADGSGDGLCENIDCSRQCGIPGSGCLGQPLTEEESAACFPTLPFTARPCFLRNPIRTAAGSCWAWRGTQATSKLVISMTDQSMRDTFVGGLQRNTAVLGIPVTAGYAETQFQGRRCHLLCGVRLGRRHRIC